MDHGDKILLGKIIKVHGFEGALTVRLEKIFFENMPLPESVFLEIEGRPVPFFVDYIEQVRPNTAHLKFIDYDNVEKVREFCGCNISLTEENYYIDETDNVNDPSGYTVKSDKNITLGIVSEVIRNQSQWLLRVTPETGKEMLIPFHEDLVIEINDRLKVIKMIIPDGLADIN